ncbi:uncharacterized protein LOC108631379 [Ceratina calcarata]|uniref:Uncharacterized protein LOC108631379 n=1 Tax=Ceratina calcarata TaxID=156304 RepID=A0AAJ7NE48_9HYME|nr:uncharacterized protein LOC108631379 [Ceratina calcarata]
MIHLPKSSPSSANIQVPGNTPNVSNEVSKETTDAKVHTAKVVGQKRSVLLATAQVTLLGPHGKQTRVRALLDQGSKVSIISKSIANLLGLEKRRANISLTGVGASPAGAARATTRLVIRSLIDPSVRLETDALVLGKITSHLPACRVLELPLDLFVGLHLADPQFHAPDSIDVILGADIYGQLLRSGVRTFPASSLVAQNTVLGWISSGPVSADASRRAVLSESFPLRAHHCATQDNLNESIQRFWKLEEVASMVTVHDLPEDSCETLFRQTHTRDNGGRYTVRLPLESSLPEIARETRNMAMRSLAHTHRRFDRDSNLALEYRKFMLAYEQLGHMERVPPSEVENPRAWYLPHHAVIQSKIRIVF